MSGSGTPSVYWPSVLFAVLFGAVLCTAALRRPGPWRTAAGRAIAIVLVAEVISWELDFVVHGTWSAQASLPFNLCDITALIAAGACWWQTPLLVELTYFWGLAGTLQAVITPDIGVPFPYLGFFNYDVEHLGIVLAAVFLVVGCRIYPRPGAWKRVFGITLVYTAFVGAVDAITGGDYMFLRAPPPYWSLLQVMGPWPWYILSATAVALVLLLVLDAPFRRSRRVRVASPPRLAELPGTPEETQKAQGP
jgi:hypothetical integral membrane protein (TIGR02206 family)